VILRKHVFISKAGTKFLKTVMPLEKLFSPYIEHNTQIHHDAAQLIENTYKELKYHMNPIESKAAKDAARSARFLIKNIKLAPTIKPKKRKILDTPIKIFARRRKTLEETEKDLQ
jgi:hypothetical protein